MEKKNNNEKFIEFLKKDINDLIKHIEKNYSELYFYIGKKDSNKTISIDLLSFKKLLNKVCYNNISHKEKMPFSSLSGEEITYFNETVYDIPQQRLDEFIPLFEIKELTIFVPSDAKTISSFSINGKELYYLFYYSVFHKYINSTKNFESILNEMLSDWQLANKNKKIPIEICLYLDKISVEKNYFNSPFSIEKILHNRVLRIDPYKADIQFRNFLCYKTEVPYIKDIINDEIENFKLFRAIGDEIVELKNFLIALYILNYYLPNPVHVVKLPWWLEGEYEYLKKFSEKKVNDYIYISHRKLTKKVFNESIKIFIKFKKKGLFNTKCFPLLFSIKNYIFSEPNRLERIFYAYTILEFLFSSGNIVDLSFNISLDAPILVSSNYQDFSRSFFLLREMYKVRSKAIHGEDWLDVSLRSVHSLQKRGVKVYDISQMFKIFEDLIRKILKRLSYFDMINSRIIKTLQQEKLLFYKLKKLIYSIRLGDFLKKEGKNNISLKCFFKAYKIAKWLNDIKKITETEKQIECIYKSAPNLIVYSNELNLVLHEISIASNLNKEKKHVAEDIISNFKAFKNKVKAHIKLSQNIPLKINGNIIMSTLKLDEGPIIGKIITKIRENIKSGNLINEEKDLLLFIKNLDLSKFENE